MPVTERRIILSLSELEIQGNSSGTICVKWSPKEAGCWRDVLQLTDNRRIKYDIIIATIAKSNKKKNIKTRKPTKISPPLSNSSNFSISTVNKQQMSLKNQTINQSLIGNLDVQIKQCIPKYKNISNKENIYEEKNETKTYILQKEDNRINKTHHYEHDKSNINNNLFEQSINMWSDGSVLPQVLLSSNVPQEIRRATYVKEKRPCSNNLHECNKEVTENTACTEKAQVEFSMLLDKFTFTSTKLMSSSPHLTKRESIDSTSSQSTDKHKTFNISDQFFDTFAISDTKIPTNTPSVLQLTDLHNSSLIELRKEHGCSLITNMKDLRASSPIQSQHNDILKDPTEYLKHSTMNVNHSAQTNDCEYFSFEVIPENIERVKETGDMYIEISPPKKHLLSKSMFSSKLVKNTRTGKITKNKILCEERNMKKLHLNDISELTSKKIIFFLVISIFNFYITITEKTPRKIPAIKVNKLSLSTLRKTKWHIPSSSRESSFRIQNKEESFIYEAFELDPFAPSVTEDPFLKKLVVLYNL